MKTKITKKELRNLTKTSNDCLNKSFSIEAVPGFNAELSLMATCFRKQVKIYFKGKIFETYIDTNSKNEFVNCVYNAIK